MLTCQFCQTEFRTSSHLFYHQRNTKTCLKIQGKQPPPKQTCRFLRDYREHSNRDRVVLPIERDILFFTNVIDECVEFVTEQS